VLERVLCRSQPPNQSKVLYNTNSKDVDDDIPSIKVFFQGPVSFLIIYSGSQYFLSVWAGKESAELWAQDLPLEDKY
jgi:hypothetical protein